MDRQNDRQADEQTDVQKKRWVQTDNFRITARAGNRVFASLPT